MAIVVTPVRGVGVMVTGATAAEIRKALRPRKRVPRNEDAAMCRKKTLLWSLAVRLVRKGKIRNRGKIKKKK